VELFGGNSWSAPSTLEIDQSGEEQLSVRAHWRTHPSQDAPYFAARFVLSDLGTKGGLVTDAAGRVLRADGTPIAGLYAAGNTAASVFGSVYPGPGAPLGSAMVFAALAVEDLLR